METPTPASSAAPHVAGRYRCGESVRLSDRTLLFDAHDTDTDTRVLVEIDEASTDHAHASARRAERLHGIGHPVLVEILDHRVERGRPTTVYAAPFGEPLADIIGERFGERVSRREALDIVDTLLSALEEFHEEGLVHGVIGPNTVFLADDGAVRLLPVVAEPDVEVDDPHEDVRAVGDLLRVMITGMGAEAAQGAVSEAGDEFALLVDKATAVDPAHRPRDASHYRALVRRAKDRLPSSPGRHAASDAVEQGPVDVPEPARGRSRRPLVLGAAAVVLLLLVATLVTWSLAGSGGEAEADPASATMPDLVGLSPDEATERLDGLAVATEISYDQVRDEEMEAGLVASVAPEEGTPLAEGDAVTISVSSGPVDLDMPDLVGEAESEAREVLEDLGFTEVTVVQEPSDSAASGTVLDTDPEAGETVAYDAPVSLTVSEGVTLPDVVGLDEAGARSEIAELGLLVEVVVAAESDRPEGEVTAQSPGAGAIVEPGSAVTLTVAPEDEETDDAETEQRERDPSDRRGDRQTDDGRDDRSPERPDESPDVAAPEVEPCTSGTWSESTTYTEGSRVVHDGREYEAVWWNSDISPADTADWGPWREVGSC
ncbi:PASTA domain-containing protein [Nocardiopsis sp. MG754419]|uniref:PASTA domain-containing protein n=1 Tax=Nocardiopsis sp. MG754419 TaxID=2259865 RepID=UPI001BAD5998|nr:PASTA domain-containing protein [Nocardiopsis sp. MG754419]MBR8742371.1 hypothetical protein [Nocardiopsis sp. MG754419]